jgi:hypothetical protein
MFAQRGDAFIDLQLLIDSPNGILVLEEGSILLQIAMSSSASLLPDNCTLINLLSPEPEQGKGRYQVRAEEN